MLCTFTEPATSIVSWKAQPFLARKPEESRGSTSFLASIQQCFCPGLSHLPSCREILQNLLAVELLRGPLLHAANLRTVPRKQKLFQKKFSIPEQNKDFNVNKAWWDSTSPFNQVFLSH